MCVFVRVCVCVHDVCLCVCVCVFVCVYPYISKVWWQNLNRLVQLTSLSNISKHCLVVNVSLSSPARVVCLFVCFILLHAAYLKDQYQLHFLADTCTSRFMAVVLLVCTNGQLLSG